MQIAWIMFDGGRVVQRSSTTALIRYVAGRNAIIWHFAIVGMPGNKEGVLVTESWSPLVQADAAAVQAGDAPGTACISSAI